MPTRTFSPMIASTETSISSPIMMLWFDLRVRTSNRGLPAWELRRPLKQARGLESRKVPVATPLRATNPVLRLGYSPAPLARRSLKPQLNQIRTWVREGRTDAWIAHQLDVSVSDIRTFKREHELAPTDSDGDEGGALAEEQDL